MAEEHNTLKNSLAEHALVHRRLLLALLVMVGFLGLIFWRFYQLQIVQYEKYETQSRDNRVRLQRLAPKRGLIFDRNHQVLAENLPSFMLVVYRDQVDNLKDTVDRLQALGMVDAQEKDDFYQRKRNYKVYEAEPIRLNLDEQSMALFAANKIHFPGVEIKATLRRYYPYANVLAHMVGYVGRINQNERQRIDPDNYAATEYIGKNGVERFYENELHGQVGYEYVETDAHGKVMRTLETTPSVAGKNLVLNIDVRLQQKAFEILGQYRGAIVALDAKTGGVLAAVSTPSYNPNWFSHRISYQQYQDLMTDLDLPLYNRTIQAQYPPGSTIKPFMGLAGLEDGVITLKTAVDDPGWFQLPGVDHRYRDWKWGGHGNHVDFDLAMEQSCDVYFYQLAYKLGVDKIHQFLDKFHFGRTTGIDIHSERDGINPSPQWKKSDGRGRWFDGDTVNIGIGQGFMLATPMQLAFATNIIANRGRVFEPRMVAEVNGKKLPPKELAPIILKNQQHWQDVVHAMELVIHSWHGTGHRLAKGLSYKMAGKSGTAQVVSIAQGEKYNAEELALRKRDHALFIAFAPVDDPLISVAVVVENGGSGSGVAGPMAKEVIEAWMDIIKQQGNSHAQ